MTKCEIGGHLGAILNFLKGPGWILGDFLYVVGDSFLNISWNFQLVMNLFRNQT